jgi:hypothetical protein
MHSPLFATQKDAHVNDSIGDQDGRTNHGGQSRQSNPPFFATRERITLMDGGDGNKSLYLIFVRVFFSQYLGLLLEQLG